MGETPPAAKHVLEQSVRERHVTRGMTQHRIGIDLGGTKIEIAVLGTGRQRGAASADRDARRLPGDSARPSPSWCAMPRRISASPRPSGIGIPGVISPATGLVKNANSIALNGHPFDRTSAPARPRGAGRERRQLLRPVARRWTAPARGYRLVFGVILGTGCGGGIVVRRQGASRAAPGRRRMGPQPAALADGRRSSRPAMLVRPLAAAWRPGSPGPSLARDCDGPGAHDASASAGPRRRRRRSAPRRAGPARRPAGARPGTGGQHAGSRCDRAGRRPVEHGPPLRRAARRWCRRYVFSDVVATPIVRNRHGDSSGVRGAAWLWPAT